MLGKSPAYTDAGGACSSYLLEQGERAALVDCGNGAFAKLRARRDYAAVEAIVISHLHGDHLLDLAPFAYARLVGPRAPLPGPAPRLHVPAGGRELLARLAAVWDGPELFERAFAISEYEPRSELELAGVTARTHPVPHYGPTHAIELIAPGGGRIVYGADGRRSTELAEAARGADVLIAEATLPEPDAGPPAERGHMAAEEAGALAREAGAGRLVLTHISDELDLERARARAAAEFGGPVDVAAEGDVYEVG